MSDMATCLLCQAKLRAEISNGTPVLIMFPLQAWELDVHLFKEKHRYTWTEPKKVRWNRSHDKVQILSASNKQHSVVLGEFSGTLKFLVGKFSFCRHISTYQISYEHRSWSPQHFTPFWPFKLFNWQKSMGPNTTSVASTLLGEFCNQSHVSDQQWPPQILDNDVVGTTPSCGQSNKVATRSMPWIHGTNRGFDPWDRGSEPKKSVSFLVILSITTWKIWKALLSTFIAKLHVSIHCLWAHPHETANTKGFTLSRAEDPYGSKREQILWHYHWGFRDAKIKLHFPEQLFSENWYPKKKRWKNLC